MKLAVFWEPPEPIRGTITDQKARCRGVHPDATYLSHPVHTTIFLLTAGDRPHVLDDALAAVRTATGSVSAAWSGGVTTASTGWFVFENDLATGGDTVTIAFERTQSLAALQRAVADALVPLRVVPPSGGGAEEGQVPPWTGAFAESMERYGFPFVGDHWLPHTTVASLPHGAALVGEITAEPVPRVPLTIDRVGLWRIDGETHTRIATAPLSPQGGTR